MSTTAALRPRSPNREQMVRALDAMRAIATRKGQPPRVRYACDRCEVAWAGAEADCWNCGNPATDYSRHAASTLQLLLRFAPGLREVGK